MPYITKNDDISVLPLSVRAQNCLRRANINTIGAMMDYPKEKFIHIRKMGKKSVEEIQSLIQALDDGTSEFVLVESVGDFAINSSASQKKRNSTVAVLIDESGSVVQDIPIKDLPLSVRARNSLTHGGYEFASQLVGVSYDELMRLQNMGKKTVEEVLLYEEKISIKHETKTPVRENIESDDGTDLAGEMCEAYGQEKSSWLKELLTVKTQFPEAMGETLIYRLYEREAVRKKVKEKIIEIIEKNGRKISKAALEEKLPQHLSNTTILSEIVLELEADSMIEMGEVMIHRLYPSVIQYAAGLQNDRERQVLQARLNGKTLQEIGEQYNNLSRERVRQITQKVLNKRPCLKEDAYVYAYDHYDFSFEDFMLAFDESAETYYYLEMICPNNHTKRKPLEEILIDTQVPLEYRKKAERAIYKQYVSIDGVRVKMTRSALVKYFVKTYCKNLTDYDVFYQQYHEWLNELGIGDNLSLAIESRTYENKLNQCDYVLWNQGRSFRYYNISGYDFQEMLSTLNLEQFEDTELSTLKLFRDYPGLMQQYDIHDEYELHNLLKKIWPTENKNVKFKKMPTIEVGNADPSNQVLSLMFQYAPISADELASRYEEEYGVKAASIRANYFHILDHYFYQGIYSADFTTLPIAQMERMKTILDRDFYTTQEVKRLYRREFPDSDESLINPYALKMLGFRVYSGYIIKNTHATAVDYFRYLLTTDDIVDARNFSKSIQNVVAYTSELYRLRADYEIVEFSPLQYINIRRLNESGITKEYLKTYCNDVARHYEKGEYFTVTSLRKEGFSHEIDDLGFEEWFYSSILLEDRQAFSYQRIGGTRIFLRGKTDANLGGMLVWLLEKYQKIDFYDLIDLLESYYGIRIPKEKLRSIIDGTDLYYDSIMESVYIDYDTYFEEI